MGNLNYVAPVFRVTDITRSLVYYQSQLGFEVSFNYDNFYAGVVREGCHVHFKQATPPERDQAAFEAAEHLDACFQTQDAQALVSEVTSAGASLAVPLRSQPYGQEFYVRDPDGYILGFVQPAQGQNT